MWIVWVLIIGFVVYWVASKAQSAAQLQDEAISPVIEVRVESSQSREQDTFTFDAGAPRQEDDGSWHINPSCWFPIHLKGVSRQDVDELRSLLDRPDEIPWSERSLRLTEIVARTNLEFVELEQYLATYRPAYHGMIDRLRNSSGEWAEASERDRADMMVEFREQALKELEAYPDCEIDVLFDQKPADPTIDDILVERFGLRIMQIYLRARGRKSDVVTIAADHYQRGDYEELVKAGLARRGTDIPAEKLLLKLKMDQLRDLASRYDDCPKFKRKSDAAAFLASKPDALKRASKWVSFRELFEILPLTGDLADIDLSAVAMTWAYDEQVAGVLQATFYRSLRATRTYERMRQDQWEWKEIKGWKTEARDESCRSCKQQEGKRFPKSKPPLVPHFAGCGCYLEPRYK